MLSAVRNHVAFHVLSDEGKTTCCGVELLRGGYVCVTPHLASGRWEKFVARCKADGVRVRLHDFTREESACLGCMAEMLLVPCSALKTAGGGPPR
jgi:hypothetical protein